jgi:hypothetical protein
MGDRGQLSSENADSTNRGRLPTQAETATSTLTVMMTKRVKIDTLFLVDSGRQPIYTLIARTNAPSVIELADSP